MGKIDEMIKRVRELDEAATPGPWRMGFSYHGQWEDVEGVISQELPDGSSGEQVAGDDGYNSGGIDRKTDADLIAEYRTIAPKLAAMVERAMDALRLVDLDRIEICDHGTCICGVVEEIKAMAE